MPTQVYNVNLRSLSTAGRRRSNQSKEGRETMHCEDLIPPLLWTWVLGKETEKVVRVWKPGAVDIIVDFVWKVEGGEICIAAYVVGDCDGAFLIGE